MVKRITAGRTRGDHRIDIGYQPLTRDAVHIKSTDADYPLIRDFQGPMCVVTQTEQDNGIGGYEQITKADGIVEHRHSIGAGGQTVAVKVIPSNGTEEIRSIHTDHLWSIDTIANQSQQVIERLSYSAWGKKRQAGWQDATIIIQSLEPRGFTGHEHLDDVGIIHMNGRVYDPELGRFLSADSIIQFPKNSQSLNRYSYVLNNPLSYTDPSGHFVWGIIVAKIAEIAAAAASNAVAASAAAAGASVGTAATVATVTYGAVYAGTMAVLTGVASEAMGGTFADGFKSGLLGAAMAGAFHYVGGEAFGAVGEVTIERVIAHGIVGGAVEDRPLRC